MVEVSTDTHPTRLRPSSIGHLIRERVLRAWRLRRRPPVQRCGPPTTAKGDGVPKYPVLRDVDPSTAAEKVLDAVWPKSSEGHFLLPIDPIVVARALGIEVYTARLPPDESGKLVKEAGGPPRVYLNDAHHKNRQRFTTAHEVGHFVDRAGDDEMEFVDSRDATSAWGTKPEERYANAFAAELLMPRREVKRYANLGAVAAARVFVVSVESMGLRLTNLQLS